MNSVCKGSPFFLSCAD
uniref:Uncharacterized protein n=1 Tax=Arundo donax TaxID=35708 RepID=A0A0A9BV32_ARUDO